MKKSFLIWTACLASSCTPAPVQCHRWTNAEVKQLQAEDKALAPDATLHAMVKDYEAICAD